MSKFENAKDLFKWLASDELTKEEIIGMLTEEMCAELIMKHNAPYLEKNGDNFDYHYDGEVVGTFKAPKFNTERLETLLYNAISCLEDYGCDKEQLEADIGINGSEYEAIMETDVENAFFTYDISFNYTVNGCFYDATVLDTKSNSRECVKPDLHCTADIIRSYLSAFYKGNELLEAVESINAIEVLVERNGEYFDRDEAEADVVQKVVALAKAPLIKPSFEGQVQQAETLKEQMPDAYKSPVDKKLEL